MQLSHDRLVAVAERWLRKTRKANVVLCEVGAGRYANGETPDALGYIGMGVGGEIIGHDLSMYIHYGNPMRDKNGKPHHARPIWSEEVFETVLVEAKASLSDFHSDRQKPFRANPEDGLGTRRFYICPDGMIDPKRHTLPEGWGLLYATTDAGSGYRRPRMVTHSKVFWPKASARETALLFKWATAVERTIGNTPGGCWGGGWKGQLKRQIHAAGSAAKCS